MAKAKEPNQIIEDGVETLFLGFYKLREAGRHQEAYDAMGSVLRMLQEDRQYLRETKQIEI